MAISECESSPLDPFDVLGVPSIHQIGESLVFGKEVGYPRAGLLEEAPTNRRQLIGGKKPDSPDSRAEGGHPKHPNDLPLVLYGQTLIRGL